MANRGVLLTPFHNMALMCPATTAADVDLHTELFEAAVRQLHLTRGAALTRGLCWPTRRMVSWSGAVQPVSGSWPRWPRRAW